MKINPDSIQAICSKWKLGNYEATIRRIAETATVRLVFLGEFSSGKTSLINRLLGTHLPVGTAPTTKSICLIAPSPDASDGQKYFSCEDGECHPIDVGTFGERLLSNNEATVLVQVKPSPFLPENVIIVDTPGEGSLSDESKLTIAYLQNVDASVFCLPVSNGTVPKHVLDFIANPFLARVHSKMIFALTFSDTRKQSEIEAVREKIIQDLKSLAAQGKFDATEIDARVIPVSSTDGERFNVDGLLSTLKKFVFSRLDEAVKARRVQQVRELVPEILATLKDFYESMHLDVKELTQKEDTVRKERDKVQEDIEKMRLKFIEFKENLADILGNNFDMKQIGLQQAHGRDEILQIVSEMSTLIQTDIGNLIRRKFGNDVHLAVSNCFVAQFENKLPSLLTRIDAVVNTTTDILFNIAFSVATMGAGGAIAGGATGAGAAVARVAAQTGTKTVATATTRAAGLTVAKAAAKTAAKTSAKTAAKSISVGSVCKFIVQVLDSVNIFKPTGEYIGSKKKLSELQTFRSSLVALANQMADEMYDEYNDVVVVPLQNQLSQKESLLESMRLQEDSASQSYLNRKKELKNDIQELSAAE